MEGKVYVVVRIYYDEQDNLGVFYDASAASRFIEQCRKNDTRKGKVRYGYDMEEHEVQ